MWHLDIPTQDELRALAQTRGYGVVSLFMPTTPITTEIKTTTIKPAMILCPIFSLSSITNLRSSF